MSWLFGFLMLIWDGWHGWSFERSLLMDLVVGSGVRLAG